ncbi:hypothetical protein AB0D24_39615 [Streptomyces javensis]|uniref:hypothetical protein n=1 Tax=Streptomyces javensis TaxID=114698 RepID=UPI0033C49921
MAAASGIVALGCLGGTPAAAAAAPTSDGGVTIANWSSYLEGVTTGFQSRRWDDVDYTEIRFTGCHTGAWDSSHFSTLDLRQDRSLQPDRSWGKKTASNCFEGSSSVSAGEWTGLAAGKHFFEIYSINGGFTQQLWVKNVYVDTTHAD